MQPSSVITLAVDLTSMDANASVSSVAQSSQQTIGVAVITGPKGKDGVDGLNGAPGAPGLGLPAGGVSGQFLTKQSGTNYDTAWEYFPPALVTNTFVVASQAAMLALAADQGDVAVRTDLNSNFILRGTNPTVLSDWQELLGGVGNVASVNGHTGSVVLTKTDVGLSNADNTSDANKPISTLTQAALDTKQPLDLDLTQIGGLTPANDDIIQRKGGVWVNRTTGQIKTDLALTKTDVGLSNVPNVDATSRTNHTGTQLASTISDFVAQVQANRLDQMAAPTASVSMNSHLLTNVLDPVSSQDAVTKAYADALANGLSVKAPVRVATTAAETVVSPSTAIDGVTLASGDRILLKNQVAASENGIYTYNGIGNPLTRATDADSNVEVKAGLYTFVDEGTANADSSWVLTTTNPITLGSTSLTFTNFGSTTVPDATTALKGKLQLAGDLAGTSALPLVKSRNFTIVVGPAGSTADSVCDGTADEVEINAAITAVNAAGGGTVLLRTGTYNTNSRIIPKSYVHIRGEGMYKTRIAPTSLSTQGVFDNYFESTPDNPTTNMIISDLEIDGTNFSRPSGRKGLNSKNWDNCKLFNLYVHDCTATGLGMDNLYRSTVDRCVVINNGTAGIYATSTLTSDNTNVTAGDTVTIGYKYAKVILTSDGTLPANNDTVTLGSVTYTFKTTLTGAANEVLIGLTTAAMLLNLRNAVNAGKGIGTTYGTGTVANPDINGYSTITPNTTVQFQAELNGTAGNSLVSTETSGHLSFASATLLGGTDVVYTFVASLAIAYDVLIGASADASLTNLSSAINAGSGSGTTYGTGTVANTQVTAGVVVAHAIVISGADYGTSYNTVTTQEASSHLSFSSAVLSAGATTVLGNNGIGIATGGMPAESWIVSNCIAYGNANNDYLAEEDTNNTGAEEMYLFANNISLNSQGSGFRNSGSPNVSFVNNYVYNSHNSGIIIATATAAHLPTNNLIKGNTIMASGAYGIYTTNSCDGYNIEGNIIINSATTAILARSSNGSITNNETSRNGANGIDIRTVTGFPIGNIVVSGNRSYNNGQSTTAYGIAVSSVVENINALTIVNNHCFDDQTAPTQNYGIYLGATTTGGSYTNFLIANNSLLGNITAAITIPSSATPITGLTVKNNVGLNPECFYSVGNITGTATLTRVNGEFQTMTLTGNTTLTMTAAIVNGSRLVLELIQDATGSRLITWPANAVLAGGALTLSTAANAVDIITFIYDSVLSKWRELDRSLKSPDINLPGAANVNLSTVTGTKFGTATNQKLAFYNSTPIVQPTGDVLTALSNLGLVASPTLSVPDITYTVVSKTANYTLTSTDNVVLGDTTSGGFTLTLPTAVGISGRVYVFKKIASANTLTIGTTSSQTIDGSTTAAITVNNLGLQVVSDGSNWRVI